MKLNNFIYYLFIILIFTACTRNSCNKITGYWSYKIVYGDSKIENYLCTITDTSFQCWHESIGPILHYHYFTKNDSLYLFRKDNIGTITMQPEFLGKFSEIKENSFTLIKGDVHMVFIRIKEEEFVKSVQRY